MMYSVFLVEDEIVTREGIRNCIDWDNTPYVFAGEAPDGEMALHVLKDIKPDILITDIKMPFMDGLALARIMKKEQPWIKIIILSGHDEFSYAKQAISIGVEEYLLKPVSSDEMLKTLQKISTLIEEEKRTLTDIESLKQKVISSQSILKERWLSRLLTGQETNGLMEKARNQNIDLLPGGYAVVTVLLSTENNDYQELSLGREFLRKMGNEQKNILFSSLSHEKQVFIIKEMKRHESEDRLYSLAQGLKFEVERNTRCRAAVGLGSIVDYSREIPQSFKEADRAIRYMRLTGKNLIIGPDDMNAELIGRNNSGDGVLNDQLRNSEIEDIDHLLEQYNQLIGLENRDRFNRFLFNDLKEALLQLLEPLPAELPDLFPEISGPEMAESTRNADERKALLASLLERWIDFRNSHFHNKHGATLIKAKQYIKDNYKDPEISLNTVASHVNISPNHFSTIFSQEVGITFIEYLTKVRIDKAKKLLTDSRMLCSDISYEVGYSDPHYFSFIFKKNSGESPSEYRLLATGK